MTGITHEFGGREGELLVIQSPAELTHESAEVLRRCVMRHLPNRDGAGVILDMTRVGLISSIGIAALLQAQESCRDRGARMVLAALNDRQRQFLVMLKLDKKFEYSGTVEDAVRLLGAD